MAFRDWTIQPSDQMLTRLAELFCDRPTRRVAPAFSSQVTTMRCQKPVPLKASDDSTALAAVKKAMKHGTPAGASTSRLK